MMEIKYRKASEIQSDIARLKEAKAGIQAKVADLKREESEVESSVGEDILAGKQSDSPAQLVRIRRDIESHNLALETAKFKLLDLESELSNADANERNEKWNRISKEFSEKIQEILGQASNLHEMLSKLESELRFVQTDSDMRHLAQDADMITGKLSTIVHTLAETERLSIAQLEQFHTTYFKLK